MGIKNLLFGKKTSKEEVASANLVEGTRKYATISEEVERMQTQNNSYFASLEALQNHDVFQHQSALAINTMDSLLYDDGERDREILRAKMEKSANFEKKKREEILQDKDKMDYYETLLEKYGKINGSNVSLENFITSATVSDRNSFEEIIRLDDEMGIKDPALDISPEKLNNSQELLKMIRKVYDGAETERFLLLDEEPEEIDILLDECSSLSNIDSAVTAISNVTFSVPTKKGGEVFFSGYDYDIQTILKKTIQIENMFRKIEGTPMVALDKDKINDPKFQRNVIRLAHAIEKKYGQETLNIIYQEQKDNLRKKTSEESVRK